MSVTLSLFAGAGWQFFDNNGVPLAGGLIYTYAAGTTTPQATYTSSSGSIAHANPIVLDSAGRVAAGEVWVTDGVSYKFVLKDSTFNTIGTYDNINSTYVAGDLANTTDPALGDALVGFRQSNASGNLTGAVGRTVHQKLQESVSVLDFGADPTGVADSYAAFQAAHDSLSAYGDARGGTIYVPAGSYTLSATWQISKQVSIIGTNAGDHSYYAGSLLTFPANTTGIRFYGSDTPTGSNALESSIANIYLTASAKSATGHGIWSTTTIKVRDCYIRFFKEHGIFINGNTPAQGVADCWQVHSTRITNCDGDGLRLVGNDSQVGTAINCQCVDNGGWGFYDNAAYTNTYIACQAAGNDTGDWYNRNATYLGGLYLGCYTESGGITDLDASCIVIGGVMDYGGANGLLPASSGLGINVPTGGRHIFQRNQIEIARIDTNNIFSGLAGFYADNSATPLDYIHMEYNRLSCKASTSTSAPIYFFNSSGSSEVGTITTSGSNTSYNTSSDYRLKENVLPMTDALDTVAKLNPVTFTWKCDGKAGQGFIAHELQAVVPDCVTGEKDAVDEEGNIRIQSVDSSFLIATLTKAVQELSAKVAALEK